MRLAAVVVTSALFACTMPTDVDEPTPAPVDNPVTIEEPQEPAPEPPAFVPATGCVYVLDCDDAIIYEAGPYDTARSYDMRYRAYSTYVVPELNAAGDNPPYRVVGSRP